MTLLIFGLRKNFLGVWTLELPTRGENGLGCVGLCKA